MNSLLSILLRCAGTGLILLSILHIPIGRHLRWREDGANLTPANEAIFHVHTLFICLVLVIMGLPCLLDPAVFLESTRAGMWMAWSFSAFWCIRLYVQWFVYPASLWRGRHMETFMHGFFTLVWLSLTALFAACALFQNGLLR